MSFTLLLADDSVTIQRVIELTFADEDITVVAVSDGDQAIARIDASPPDIVLADIGMPGKSGYEVAQYIKRTPKLAKIPVVLLTGAFEPVDEARASEAGCDGILAKPFEPQLVISRVKELLGQAPPAKPAAVPTIAAAAAPAARSAGNTAEYFDRLDAAFSSAAAAPPAALVDAANLPKGGAKTGQREADDRKADVRKADDMDLPMATPAPSQPPVDLPLGVASFHPERPAAPTAAAPTPVAPPTPAPPTPALPRPSNGDDDMPAQPVQMPSLADAFAALLAAEQAEPLPPGAIAWPASGPPSDAIAEQVTRRVLDQMSDKIVRETVTALVAQIAERLVREEIDKIKASVK